MAATDTDMDPVTPSEVVLLRADDLIMSDASRRFRSPTPLFHGQERLDFTPGGAKFRLAEGRSEFPGDAWALAMLAVAFLALESKGWLSFEIHEQGKWAGLSTSTALVAVPTRPKPKDGRWPGQSLEDRLSRQSFEREVGDSVKDWLEEDSQNPAARALERSRENLVCRDLIDEEQVKRFGLFSVPRFRVPTKTDELLPSEDGVLTLVEDCLQDRPEIWSSLNHGVRSGIVARTEDPDYG